MGRYGNDPTWKERLLDHERRTARATSRGRRGRRHRATAGEGADHGRPPGATAHDRHHRHVRGGQVRGRGHLRGHGLLLHRQPAAADAAQGRRTLRAGGQPGRQGGAGVRRAGGLVLRATGPGAGASAGDRASPSGCSTWRRPTRRWWRATSRPGGPIRCPGRACRRGSSRSAGLLSPLRAQADVVIDTTGMSPRELRRRLEETLLAEQLSDQLFVSLESFGYKYGLPG